MSNQADLKTYLSGMFDAYQGLTGPYTYSDMTGWGLSSVTNPQG